MWLSTKGNDYVFEKPVCNGGFLHLSEIKQSATVLEVISVITAERIQVGAIKKNLY